MNLLIQSLPLKIIEGKVNLSSIHSNLKPVFSLNNSSNKFFMLFLLTGNKSLKLLLSVISTL